MYKVYFTARAAKSLKKIPHPYHLKIKEIIPKLTENPFALDIKKLASPHKTSHRLRLGAYRLFLDIDSENKEIIIVDLERRTTKTYR